MANELQRFLQAVREVRDDPCDKTREALREAFSLLPCREDCPAPWRACLGPEATPYLDIPMAGALWEEAGALPARYGFTRFCPNSDDWLDQLARDLCATRLFASLWGKKAPDRNPSPAADGAERFLLDWLVCVAGRDQYLQRQLAPEHPGLAGYLAAGVRRLLQRTQPLWFAAAVVPLRESLREVLTERLQTELQEALRRRKEDTCPLTDLPLCARLAPGKAAAVRSWLAGHTERLAPRGVPSAARRLARLLLPYPSVDWKPQAVLDLPEELVREACLRCGGRAEDKAARQFAAVTGSAAHRVLAEVLQGQTPATNDLAVRLDNGLKKLGCADTGDAGALERCLRDQEEVLLEEMLSGREKKGDRSPFALLRFLLLQLLRAPVACYGGEENLRGKLFRLGFALGLDADSVESRLLQPLDLPGIDYKTVPELIRAYCLNRYAGTDWGYALAAWMGRVYGARYRARVRSGSVRPPQPGRLTHYWQERYHGLVALTDRGDDRALLDAMLRDNIPPEDLLEALRRPDAGLTPHLYSSLRYRAGVMVIDLSLRRMQEELTRAQTDMQRQQLFRQQDRPMGESGLTAYRRALALTDGIPARALHRSLVEWIRPVFPFSPPLEGDEKAQTRMLQDLLDRIRRDGALSRRELMGLAAAWYLRVRRPGGDDRRAYRDALFEELDALLRECRLAPCRPDDEDAEFAAAVRRILQRASIEAPV